MPMRWAHVCVCLCAACPESAPPRDDRSPCAALCEHLESCGAPSKREGVAACTKTCDEDPRQSSGPCREPRIAYERCMVGLSCDQFRANEDLEAAKQGPCAKEVAAVLACEPSTTVPTIDFQF
jgi:hypothetical protein